MATRIRIPDTTSGRTYVVQFIDNNGDIWNGVDDWVAEETLTDAQLTTTVGLVTSSPVVSSQGTHLRYEVEVPAGITVPFHASAYLTSYTPGDDEVYDVDYDPQIEQILADTGTDGVVVADKTGFSLAASEDVYHADIYVTVDEANTQDEYTAVWFKNGVRITSGITSPTIQVAKRVDGTDLVASVAMTQIGSTGSYKYDEATNRLTAGEAAVAIVSATIDAASRSFASAVGRDSSA